MDHTPQVSNNTKLKNRTLWFDGDSSYPPEAIHMAGGNQLFVNEITKDIEQFNRLVPVDKKIRVKTANRPFKFDWKIPDEYKNLDLAAYVIDKLSQEQWDEHDLKKRVVRVVKELKLYEHHRLTDVLRVLIYVINTLSSKGVVWGVGRGSSVSSYVLYLIGVHDVDSVKYELDIEDFLH